MPLPTTLANALRKSFLDTVRTLGVPADYVSSQGQPDATFYVGFASPTKTDDPVVNAYGIEAKVITVPVDAPLTAAPLKFDAFVINGKRFIAQATHDILINDVLVGWKVVANGGR